MRWWRWIVGAVAGLLGLFALLQRRPAAPPPATPTVDPVGQAKQDARREAEEARARAAAEQARAEEQRAARDQRIRQEAEERTKDDPVDRAAAHLRRIRDRRGG